MTCSCPSCAALRRVLAHCRALFTAATVIPRIPAASEAEKQHVRAEDQRPALAGRQLLQRSDERQSQTAAVDHPGDRVRQPQHRVRQWLQPGNIHPHLERRVRRARGATNPDGSGLRERDSSAVRHTFVAIRYSQVRREARLS